MKRSLYVLLAIITANLVYGQLLDNNTQEEPHRFSSLLSRSETTDTCFSLPLCMIDSIDKLFDRIIDCQEAGKGRDYKKYNSYYQRKKWYIHNSTDSTIFQQFISSGLRDTLILHELYTEILFDHFSMLRPNGDRVYFHLYRDESREELRELMKARKPIPELKNKAVRDNVFDNSNNVSEETRLILEWQKEPLLKYGAIDIDRSLIRDGNYLMCVTRIYQMGDSLRIEMIKYLNPIFPGSELP